MISFSRLLLSGCILLMISCTEELPPEDVFENPLDEDEVTYETPALTFYPLENDVNLGTSFTVSVYGLGIDNLGGSYVRVGYDKTKLSVLSISVGDFFTDAVQTPIFFYENNTENSFVDIYTSFLGTDSTAVSGTGSLAQIVFTSITAGTSNLTYGIDCELVTPGDDAIEIKGFGEGVVNAQ